jgi:antitoxin ParD1/3/4
MARLQQVNSNEEVAMSSTLNLSLTDELRAFVDQNSGDGTLYATPSEFVRDLLRQKKEELEAARIRNAILEGYEDALRGGVVEYRGNLRSLLRHADR